MVQEKRCGVLSAMLHEWYSTQPADISRLDRITPTMIQKNAHSAPKLNTRRAAEARGLVPWVQLLADEYLQGSEVGALPCDS